MPRIPKTKVYNPQKAEAYVGKGVLKTGGKITPVPNGPLVKKKGPLKGSTLKTGGAVKSKVNAAGNYTKPGMRKSLFNSIKAGSSGGNAGQWSARKAQLLAKKYKAAGGGYKN